MINQVDEAVEVVVVEGAGTAEEAFFGQSVEIVPERLGAPACYLSIECGCPPKEMEITVHADARAFDEAIGRLDKAISEIVFPRPGVIERARAFIAGDTARLIGLLILSISQVIISIIGDISKMRQLRKTFESSLDEVLETQRTMSQRDVQRCASGVVGMSAINDWAEWTIATDATCTPSRRNRLTGYYQGWRCVPTPRFGISAKRIRERIDELEKGA